MISSVLYLLNPKKPLYWQCQASEQVYGGHAVFGDSWNLTVINTNVQVIPLTFRASLGVQFFFLIFIYLWLCWVFVSVQGLSPVVASGGHSSSRCAGLSLSRHLLSRSTGSRRAGSVVVAHGPSCSAARGIFPDRGSNPCPLHWQANAQPLRHQGSPGVQFWSEWIFLPKSPGNNHCPYCP